MDEERSGQVNSVILKGAALLAAFAIVVAMGTFAMVKVLGLDESGSADPDPVLGSQAPTSPLPTTALPQPSDSSSPRPDSTSSDDAGEDPEKSDDDAGREGRGLRLSATPTTAAPMERINLTGRYRGHDNLTLQVQRMENGTWADFPTQARVTMGTYETYVMTSRPGENRFRVYDPQADRASNVVAVTVG